MSDPFGALAMQATGDVGVFVGSQWTPSGNLVQPAMFRSPGGQITSTTTTGWTFVNADLINIFDGSSTKPVSVERPSFQVTRWEAQGGGQVQNGAIQGIVIANNTLAGGTTQAIRGYAEQRNAGDIVGIDATSVIAASPTGTGQAAYGFYTAVADFSGAGYVVGINPALQVTRDQAYTTTPPFSNGVFVQGLLAAGGTTAQAYRIPFAYGAFANTPADVLFDVGFAAIKGVKSAAFRDDTNATTSFETHGTHTVGIDLSAATNTTHIKFSSTFNISGSAAQIVWNTTAGAAQDYISGSSDFRFVQNSVVLVMFRGGTPGAGNTTMFLTQGATPTNSQIKYKDGASIGAGDNVLYF